MKALMRSLTLFVAVLLFAPAFAQHPPHPPKPVKAPPAVKHNWENLGTKKVDMSADVDHLLVTAYEGVFTKVKFQVHKAPIHMKSITVIFANGETKKININKDFTAGSGSKVFDLPGNKRIIQKIKFEYKTIDTGNGKAKVTVFGKH